MYTCEVVVLLIKPIVFLTFSLSAASLDLKVSIIQAEGVRASEGVSSSNIAVVDMLHALHVSVAKLAQFSRTESLVKS